MTMMIRPVRLQLSRKKGFDLQALSLRTNGLPAINCTRSSRSYGNPFFVNERHEIVDPQGRLVAINGWRPIVVSKRNPPRGFLADAFEIWIALPENATLRAEACEELAGNNLACWCPVHDRCHVDVWLRLANPAKAAA
jgi:hypothetical protein